jgi:4-aminobutyrate aminotransferase-like enzyme
MQSRIPPGLRQQPNGPVWAKSDGSTVWDTTGRSYLDLSGGFGVAAVGHSRPEVAAAVERQSRQLSYAMTGIFPHATEEPALSRIAELTGFAESGAVLMTTSGSEAIDVSLRVAALASGRSRFLAFENGYHGQTLGTVGVNGQEAFRRPFANVVGQRCDFVSFTTEEDDDALAETALRQVREQLESREVAAVLIEPMQNIAGYRVAHPQFLRGLRELCDTYNSLLIIDEVFTGFGRTGTWSMANEMGVRADLLCVGKAMTGGLPAGACVAEMDLLDVLSSSATVPLHSPTYLAVPSHLAGVEAAIGLLSDEGLLERARWIDEAFRERLLNSQPFADLGLSIRGRGAALAIEFATASLPAPLDAFMSRLQKALLDRGLIALRSGFPAGSTLALSPPLVLTGAELDEAAERLVNALEDVKATP